MGRGRELHGGGNGSEMPEEVEKKSKATERSWGKGGGAVGGGGEWNCQKRKQSALLLPDHIVAFFLSCFTSLGKLGNCIACF